MIEVHKLNGEPMVINAELIESVEANPDTVVTLTNGKSFVVEEPVWEVVRRVIGYRRQVYAPEPVAAGGEAEVDEW